MIRRRGELRSLVDWLLMQERVLHLWIDEIVSVAPQNAALVRNLERHCAWLSSRIDEMTGRRAPRSRNDIRH